MVTDHYDRYHLTVTLGLGAGAFEKLGTTPDDRPQDLRAIPWPQLGDATVATPDNSDVVMQACSDAVYINEHVFRRVAEQLADVLTPVVDGRRSAAAHLACRADQPRRRPRARRIRRREREPEPAKGSR
ncbi:MAG: hypothetical protein QOD83_4953 [Solirubrobacteraceae bacterium]|nr:hypothetical protein [Solirubrobacteraceae bacterium]